jgi:hypothetical protein
MPIDRHSGGKSDGGVNWDLEHSLEHNYAALPAAPVDVVEPTFFARIADRRSTRFVSALRSQRTSCKLCS